MYSSCAIYHHIIRITCSTIIDLRAASKSRHFLWATHYNYIHIYLVRSPFQHIFRQQITDLILVFENNSNEITWKNYTTYVHKYILRYFKNLKHLSITELVPASLVLRDLPITTFHSSTLQKLSIHVMCYDDLFALLDGRFKQLNALHVVIINTTHSSRNVYNMVSLNFIRLIFSI